MTTALTTESTEEEEPQERALSMVADLRRLVPSRPLSFAEACRVAELQANRLLLRSGSTTGAFDETIITELPRIAVRRSSSLISSGATAWSRRRWHIRLNGAEPTTRQRFTLAHEFKHILDASCEDVIYRLLPVGRTRQRHVEAVCDHFAACVLMPKVRVKSLWFGGVQDLSALAWRFEVSQQAMLIRLQYLGLVPPLPRHTRAYRIGATAVHGTQRPTPPRRHRAGGGQRYFRSARPQVVHALRGVLT